MPITVCKRSGRRSIATRSGVFAAAFGAAVLSACSAPPAARTVSVRSLELAQRATTASAGRAIISDDTAVAELIAPLGPRLGLLRVRTPAEWRRLTRSCKGLGPEPDFSRGMVVGVVSRVGVPLNETWPIHLNTIRLCDRAGYVQARFESGTYLPNGATFIDTAYCEGLDAVLIVDINGVRFYPE